MPRSSPSLYSLSHLCLRPCPLFIQKGSSRARKAPIRGKQKMNGEPTRRQIKEQAGARLETMSPEQSQYIWNKMWKNILTLVPPRGHSVFDQGPKFLLKVGNSSNPNKPLLAFCHVIKESESFLFRGKISVHLLLFIEITVPPFLRYVL